jgi:hypothetical protein
MEIPVRQKGGKYVCAQCGAALEVTREARPRVEIQQSPDAPMIRVLSIDGREIHRCEIRKSS